ncbi:MAG: UPF0262 family protein [Pseudomonadota bacterium]
MAQATSRLVDITLDPASFGRATPDVEHERAVAIYDLLELNEFHPVGREPGDCALSLSVFEQKLVFDIEIKPAGDRVTHILSLSPFRSAMRDYHMICESYYDAIRTASTNRIESIDMARRGVHNQASELLQERLAGKIDIDHDTARRLFTLISALGTSLGGNS